MFDFVQLADPNYQAFITGFLLPVVAAISGYSISIVRNLLSKVNNDRL